MSDLAAEYDAWRELKTAEFRSWAGVVAASRSRPAAKALTSGGQWPGDLPWFLDAFGVVRSPKAAELVREFEGVTYACVSIKARTAASVPYRLIVQTRPGERKARCRTRPLASAAMKALGARRHWRAKLASAVVVEEVEDHPLLDLLNGMGSRDGGYHLWQASVEYLEVVGQAFWWPRGAEAGPMAGVPQGLSILPAQEVSAKKGETVDEALVGWEWGRNKFGPDELVWFRHPSLAAPFTGCYSPTIAAWTDILLSDKASSRIHRALDNQPDATHLISPSMNPAALPMGEPGEAPLQRLETKLRQKLFVRRDPLVIGGIPLNVSQLGMDARMLELAAQRGFSRETVADCHGIPPAMLTTATNLDNLKAAFTQLMRQAIAPLLDLLDGAINAQLVPLFDDSGRLLLVHDDCVPADIQTQIAQETADLANGTRTINEVRAEHKLDPIEGGDEPLVASGKAPLSQIVARDLSAPSPFAQSAPAARPVQPPPENAPGRDEGEGAAPSPNGAAKAPPRGSQRPPLPKKGQCPHCNPASGKQPVAPPPAAVAEGDAANPAINIHRLPDGKALAGVISRVARRQREAILKAIRGNLEAALKAVPIGGKKALSDLPGIDWSAWDEEFAKNCAPVMQLYAEDGAHKVNVRLGATDEEAAWRVQLPQVREAVQKAAMQFAESTNATTSLQLDQAIVKLREDLAAGILEGPNTLRDLTKRVEAIFTGLEGDRARMIALTESSRAVHQGQLIAAEQSGMVQGMKWLAHPGACDACQEMAAEERDLGESFADDGAGGPYSVVDMPPLHPNCLCTVTEVLKPLGELLAAADQLGDGFRPEE